MINDPTWGILKNLGGPDNTLGRHGHINENEYPIWRYNRMFRRAGFDPQQLFSRYYDQKLLNFEIHPGTRFAPIAKMAKRLWKIPVFRKVAKSRGLWFAQAVFGFPMNAVLRKSKQ